MSCIQNPNLQLSSCRRMILFLVGAMECLFFGGIVFGWPQLVHLLKMDNVYSYLCNDVDTAAGDGINQYKAVVYGELFNNSRCIAINASLTIQPGHKVGVEQCAPQDDRFALIFTIALACYGIPSFLVGFLLHHAGLWATRILAGVMLCVGFIFLGITTEKEPNWLFPAMILLALGGNQIRMASLQLADLFPANKATALTILTCMYATSASLFLVFQVAERYKVEREIICWILAGLSSGIIFFTFIMPVHHIPVTDDYKADELNEQEGMLSRDFLSNVMPKQNKDLPLRGALFSLSSFLYQYWLFINLFAINVYQMTYNYWITIVSCTNDEAELFTVAYSYVNFASAFIAPLFGLFVDKLVARARLKGKSYSDCRVKEIQSNVGPLLVTTISTFIMYICLMFFYPSLVYVSLAFMALSRPTIVSVSTAYMRIRFPVEHFNRLIGFHFSITSAMLMLMYPHFQWSQVMYHAAHGVVLVGVAVSVLNPLHLCIRPLINKTLGSPHQIIGAPVITNTKQQNNKFSSFDQ